MPQPSTRRRNLVYSLCSVLAGLTLTTGAHAEDASSDKAPPPLDEILVTGRRLDGYVASDALTGTKTAAPLRDLPLSVQVVSEDLLHDRNIVSIGDALETVSGAQRVSGYGGGPNFGLNLRGFSTNNVNLRNGFRDAGFQTLRDTANVYRFEVLKGPASVLYGSLSPGGITNTITKKAVRDTFLDARAYAGGNDYYRAEIDANTMLSQDIRVRFNGAFEDNDSFRDTVHNRGVFLAPTATWDITDRLRWTVEAEYKKSDFTWDHGLPVSEQSFKVPVNRFVGEKDGVNHVNSLMVLSSLEYQLTDGWKLRQNTSLSRTNGDYNLRSFYALASDDRTVLRAAYADNENTRVLDTQTELVGDVNLLGLIHKIVVGYEYYNYDYNFVFDFQDIGNIDLFDPVYGYKAGSRSQFPLFGTDTVNKAHGVYAQDLIALTPDIKLLLGGRYDHVRSVERDLLAGKVTKEKSDSAFSPQVGLVYQPTPSTSLYANYSTSFVPTTSGTFRAGTTPKPEKGRQYEVGIKQTFFGNRLSATLAAFSIVKENVVTPDPANPVLSIQTGEQKSRGIEFDLAASLLRGLSVTAAGAYLDAYVSNDNVIPVGSRLIGVPKWSGNVFARYTVQDGALKGLRFGGGVFHDGKRKAALPNPTWDLPSYVRLDGLVGYGFGKWDVQLNVNNITNEKIYFMNGRMLTPQAPRNVLLRVSHSF